MHDSSRPWLSWREAWAGFPGFYTQYLPATKNTLARSGRCRRIRIIKKVSWPKERNNKVIAPGKAIRLLMIIPLITRSRFCEKTRWLVSFHGYFGWWIDCVLIILKYAMPAGASVTIYQKILYWAVWHIRESATKINWYVVISLFLSALISRYADFFSFTIIICPCDNRL